MSVPYELISCDACGSTWPTYVSWGLFQYKLPDNRSLSVDRDTGWCHECGAFRPIEELLDLATIERKISDLDREISDVAAAQMGGSLAKRLAISLRPKLRKRLADRSSILGKQLDDARTALRWRERRVGPERCLECGSTKVEHPLRQEREEPHLHEFYRLSFQHPRCGGQLFVRPSDIRIAMIFDSTRLYDGEGQFLGVTPGRLPPPPAF